MAIAHKIPEELAGHSASEGRLRPIPRESKDANIARNAENYDRMPYTSHPFSQTQPSRMSALAQLFGLMPPPLKTARVLEIGCASGGNLIPLAVRFPEAHFTGIDISAVQLDDGGKRIERLHLKNIDLQCVSITDFEAEPASFDYIICHGVFSWVEAGIREAILANIGKLLTSDGLAYVSYNVMPGWRMRQALRDAMILHAGSGEDPAHRVSRARWMLNFLKDHTATSSPWGQMFRNEANLLSRLPDDYILHEFLEETNEPMTFTAFAEQAGCHGLAYLGDADIAQMVPENLDPATALMLREICGGQTMPIEQYMDIVTGRTFRQSLLVRAEKAVAISRALDPAKIAALQLVASRDICKQVQADQSTLFFDGAGRNLRTIRQEVVQALDILIARLPGSTSMADMLDEAMDANARAMVIDALAKMLQVGLIHLAAEPIPCRAHIGEKPEVACHNRSDGTAGPFAVNARHESISLGLVAQILLPALDGTRDRAQLEAVVLAAVSEGKLIFQREGVAIVTAEGLAREAASHVDLVLRDLALAGLLVS